MEIQIENLKAKMRGEKLNHYQEGLALDEFEKLIAHAETLGQQLRQHNVVGQREPLVCPCCGSDKTYKTDAIHCNRCAVTTEI